MTAVSTDQTSTWRETVLRPSGKPYRARRPPTVEEFSDSDGWCYGLLVLRTHDIDVATALAWHHWQDDYSEPSSPRLGWTKLVPWGSGDIDRTWLDLSPSDRGAVPCVWFEATW